MIAWEERQSRRSASRHSHKRSHADLVANRNCAFIPGTAGTIFHISAARVVKRHFQGHARRARRMGDRSHGKCREQDNHKKAGDFTHSSTSNVPSNLCPGPICRRLLSPLASPGTAGEFGYVHIEGLGGQLKAFNGREIGKDHVSEFSVGHALLDRDCRSLNAVGALGCQDMSPD